MKTYMALLCVGFVTLTFSGSVNSIPSVDGSNFCGDMEQGTHFACPMRSRCIEVGETSGGVMVLSQTCQTPDGTILAERRLERNASPGLIGNHIAMSEVRPRYG